MTLINDLQMGITMPICKFKIIQYKGSGRWQTWFEITCFNGTMFTIIYQHRIILKIIRGCIKVFAGLLMVTSAHIIRKGYLPLIVYILDKALLLSTVRA